MSPSLSSHEESRAAGPRPDVEDLHAGLEVEHGHELLSCRLSSRANKSLPEYFLVPRDTIPKFNEIRWSVQRERGVLLRVLVGVKEVLVLLSQLTEVWHLGASSRRSVTGDCQSGGRNL